MAGRGVSADSTEYVPFARAGEREIEEETGVVVADMAYVSSRIFTTDDGRIAMGVLLLATHVDGAGEVRAPDEVDAVAWLTPDEIRARDGVPAWIRSSLDDIEEFQIK